MRNFIKHYLKAKTKNQVQSPFVHEFMEQVLEDDRYFYAFDNMETFYFWLERYKKMVLWNGEKTTAKDIFKSLAVQPQIGQLLFRIANHYQYKNIIEIGNGLNSIWMAQAIPDSQVLIIDENKDWSGLLQGYVNKQNNRTSVFIDDKLSHKFNISVKMPSIDVLIFDATQTKFNLDATFNQVSPYLHKNSVIIQINKNNATSPLWDTIKQRKEVQLTLDLFQIGFAYFYNKDQSTQHFQLIDNSWKPWSTGFLNGK